MKCTIFIGEWYDVIEAFNDWAKGKALTREVIIQSHATHDQEHRYETQFAIFVFHPDDYHWNSTLEKHIPVLHQEINRSDMMTRTQVTQ